MALAPTLMIAFLCMSPEPEVRKPTVDSMLLGEHVDPRLAENWSGVPRRSAGESGGAAADGPPGPTCAELGLLEDFEIVQVIFGEQEIYILPPRMNNCGEIVFTRGLGWQTTSEIFRYDNGFIEQLTVNNTPDAFPDINDAGTVIWNPNFDSIGNGEIAILDEGVVNPMGNGCAPRINTAGKATWDIMAFPQTCAFEVAIKFFDGLSTTIIHNDGFSNQLPVINSNDEIVWTRFDFCPQPWVSEIGHYSDGQVSLLPGGQTNPQLADIDNTGRAAWSDDFVEVWDGVQAIILTSGRVPGLNDLGDVAYQDKTDFTPWQVWLYNDGNPCRLTGQEDIDNLIDNGRAEINNFGEVAWMFSPNGEFMPSGIRYLRRIRSGDLDLDDAVDFGDFAPLPGCMTGVGDFDRLCDCRFLDMQHDRDVDIGDGLMFQNRYDRPALGDDCCIAHAAPGCNDPEVEACVCAQVPSCCSDGWGDGCVLFADILGCADCLAPFVMDVSVQSPSAANQSRDRKGVGGKGRREEGEKGRRVEGAQGRRVEGAQGRRVEGAKGQWDQSPERKRREQSRDREGAVVHTDGNTTGGTGMDSSGIPGVNEITVGPGTTVAYEIIAQLSDAVSNDGLAGFSLDLKLAEVALAAAPASVPPGMSSFSGPLGLTNPSGFGGVLESAALRQIGGLQNTFGDSAGATASSAAATTFSAGATSASATTSSAGATASSVGATASSAGGSPPPTGDVVTGIAHSPTIIATGTITAPMELGTYTLTIENLAANALTTGPSPLGAWQTRQAGIGTITALTIIVGDPEPIPAVTTWGIAIMTILIITAATLLIRARVSPVHRFAGVA